MVEVLHGQIKHSFEQHRYKDALFMTTEEYFSKYELTLTNKLILKLTRPFAFFGALFILFVIAVATH